MMDLLLKDFKTTILKLGKEWDDIKYLRKQCMKKMETSIKRQKT